MKILFMGTPDFAAKSLEMLAESDFDIAAVISQPDKPKGRGHRLQPTEVKMTAEKFGYKVYQPETLKNGAISDLLDDLKPDLIVVAAYGKILPEYVINYPKYGCINVHASLLPKYRGAAPIQRAIIDGEPETGVTIMKMERGLDTGDILSVSKTPIGEFETAGELFDRLAKIGGELLAKTIPEIFAGNITPRKQDNDKATYASMIAKDTGVIEWNKTSREIINLVRGLNPWPLAYTLYKGEILKLVTVCEAQGQGTPGEILSIDKGKGMRVATGGGAVYIHTAQFKNSKKMPIEDYARGHKIEIGTILGG